MPVDVGSRCLESYPRRKGGRIFFIEYKVAAGSDGFPWAWSRWRMSMDLRSIAPVSSSLKLIVHAFLGDGTFTSTTAMLSHSSDLALNYASTMVLSCSSCGLFEWWAAAPCQVWNASFLKASHQWWMNLTALRVGGTARQHDEDGSMARSEYRRSRVSPLRISWIIYPYLRHFILAFHQEILDAAIYIKQRHNHYLATIRHINLSWIKLCPMDLYNSSGPQW